MDWLPINLKLLSHPLNWVMVIFVLILLGVLLDAFRNAQQS